MKSIENGYGAYFVRAYDLMEDLRKVRAENRLDRRMRVYLAPKVLIIDEFGIWPYDRESATAFFSLVSARYERGSIILTSNKGFSDWGELLGDAVIATAIQTGPRPRRHYVWESVQQSRYALQNVSCFRINISLGLKLQCALLCHPW